MAKSNIDRVNEALRLFQNGYRPFVARQMEARHGKKWEEKAAELLREKSKGGKVPGNAAQWDAAAIIDVIQNDWQYNFRKQLDNTHRNLLFEIRDIRNQWAHQQAFSTQDTVRALDTIKRALDAVSASEQAASVDQLHQETMRVRFQEMQRAAAASARKAAVSGEPMGGLRPWREVIQPHPDVAKGQFSTSEFAADLAQVLRGGAPEEYGDPRAFYRRTYLTEGLSTLLKNAIKRLHGKGGHPVIELQTNFGGGKTHSMLALFHLVDPSVKAGELAGVDSLIKQEGLGGVPAAKRAVLVGTALGPGQPETTRDAIELRTLWGRMAYQLGGKEGYRLLAEYDRTGTAPGSDDLVKLFKSVGPCIVLIDEWVAFCRQMYEKNDLPAGTFDGNLTFAQALTEAIKASPEALLVASLPQSSIEVGGEGGLEALKRLEDTFARLEFNWQPANQDESYEIVRRRLFEPIPVEQEPAKDAVVSEFASAYTSNQGDFPEECRELSYQHKLSNAYPIHPEVFDRLYNDWSRLEQFQRTRGVLRLMAATIHQLWLREDRSLMIMPCHVCLDEQEVRDELTRHSGTAKAHWDTIIQHDIDGPNSIPKQLDSNTPRYGKVSAARRVARTIFLGSAPVGDSHGRGIDIRRVRLGCVQPGENPPVFADAARALADDSSHLYVDQSRYWYDDQPNVNRTAADRAAQISGDDVVDAITKRLKPQAQHRGPFASVHVCPETTGDVPDDRPTRFVILPPTATHSKGSEESPAVKLSHEYLDKRGNSPRLYRNALIFLTADRTALDGLKDAVRNDLAWQSIVNESDELNLAPINQRLAREKRQAANQTVHARLNEAFGWLLVPNQPDPMQPIVMTAIQQRAPGWFAERAGQRLERDGLLNTTWAGSLLRKELDERLWQGNHYVRVKDLADYFSQYIYLDRLASPDVLFEAIASGVSSLTWRSDGFAYAERYDADKDRYAGLQGGASGLTVRADDHAVVVHPDAADSQLQRETPADTANSETTRAGDGDSRADASGSSDDRQSIGGTERADTSAATSRALRRFFGSVELNPQRAGRDAGKIAEEVLAHLTSRSGAKAKVTLEIDVSWDEPMDEATQRVVTENCNTLKFESHGLEEG